MDQLFSTSHVKQYYSDHYEYISETMNNTSAIVILCLGAFWFFALCCIVSPRELQVLHFGKCENYHDVPMIMTENEVIVYDGKHKKTVIDVDVKEDITDLQARLSIYKCTGNGSICRYVWEDHKIRDICDKISSDDIMVRFIIDSTTPKITSCPIKKGFYETTFSSGHTFFHNFSLAEGLWTVKWSLFDKEEMVTCYECQVNITDY